jgi:hypothetical protein
MGKLCAWSIPLSKMFIGKRKLPFGSINYLSNSPISIKAAPKDSLVVHAFERSLGCRARHLS